MCESATRRGELLAQAKLNEPTNVLLKHGALPDGLVLWARLTHASESELLAAAAPSDLERPLSDATEVAAYAGLLTSLDEQRAKFEHR